MKPSLIRNPPARMTASRSGTATDAAVGELSHQRAESRPERHAEERDEESIGLDDEISGQSPRWTATRACAR